MRKKQVDNTLPEPEKLEFKAKNNKDHKIEAIIDSVVHGQAAND